MVDNLESFLERDSVLAWESSITSFRSAAAKALDKSVPVLLSGIVLGSLGVVGGPRGGVLKVPAGVFGSHWFVPRGSETPRHSVSSCC
jgi:hypothetical protein